MKKRLLALAAALVLLCSTALAAADSLDNFTRQRSYAGQFSDLSAQSTFYDNIVALYEYGLTQGKADGTYGLQDSVTVGQTVIFAGRIRSLYRTGDPESGPAAYTAAAQSLTEPYRTYFPYLSYLKAEGVLDSQLDNVLHLPATRAQVAHVLCNVLPESALPAINDTLVTHAYASRDFITDVTEYTPYFRDILQLYRCGVVVGSDATGSYRPDALITRGAVAAMLTRMVDESLRLTPDWDVPEAYSAAGTTYMDLVTPGTYLTSPLTREEMDSAIRYMLSQGANALSLRYSSMDAQQAQTIMNLALSVIKSYCEQGYNSVECTYNTAGAVTLRFFAAGADGNLETYRAQALESAIAVHDQLWESGQITSAMTQMEKAKVYYTWICDNCFYDEAAGDTSLSHIPYSLFRLGRAVCDGYTGAYNLLLLLEGISCTSQITESHIWTVATLDGVSYHIDTTWGDSSGKGPDYRYFAMSAQQSYAYHPW